MNWQRLERMSMKRSVITKLSAKYVIGYERNSHVIYENGCVVYAGDTILYVGTNYEGVVDSQYEFPNGILSPGFIDLDADVDSDHALQDIAVGNKVFTLDRTKDLSCSYTEEDYHARHRFSIAHLMKNGITTVLPISGEMFYPWNMSTRECEIMMEEADTLGIRMYIGPSFKSRKFPEDMMNELRGRKSFEEAIAFCERAFPKRILPFINPCQIHITDLRLLKEAAHYGQEYHIPYRIHACEAAREWKYTHEQFHQTTITLFQKENMLYDQFIIPHCITATNEELQLLAQHHVSVVSTPFADCNTGTALFSFDKYVDYGINMTMGTDAHPGDMLRNMKMAWDLDHLCHRRKFFSTYLEDGTMIPMLPYEPMYPKTDAKHYFDAATINGAKALGREDLGKLCAGAKADIIVINIEDITIGPLHDPIRSLINSATGSHVQEVIIDGITRIHDFAFVDISVDDILKQAQSAYDRYVALYEAYDAQGNCLEELFPSSYPIIRK